MSRTSKAPGRPCRCAWAESDPLLTKYHDREWGVPVRSDRVHFQFLVLEAAQAGLSWLTVLRKRPGYRRHFANFDFRKVAKFGESEVRAMLADPGVIRHEGKIRAAVANARALLAVRQEFGTFDRYLRSFAGDVPIVHAIRTMKDIPASTPLSDAIAKDLKRRGFQFVGTTVIYAHLQAVGIVDDHQDDCFRKRARAKGR